MRSTNYSRKKRGSRKSLRGGRKSLRRRGRKSLRGGRKSSRRRVKKSLRGGANDLLNTLEIDSHEAAAAEEEEEAAAAEEEEEAAAAEEEEEQIESMGETLENLSDTVGGKKAETVNSNNILLRRYSQIFYNPAMSMKKSRLEEILEFIKTKLNQNMLDISKSLIFPTELTKARDLILTKLNTAETATKVCKNETPPYQPDKTCIKKVFQQGYKTDITTNQLFVGYENIESRGGINVSVPFNRGKSKFYMYSNLFTDTSGKLFKIKCSINRYRGKGRLVWNSKLKIRPVNFPN